MVLSHKKLLKLAIKHDGSPTKIAKSVGVSHQAISDRFKKNPQLKKIVLNAREQALKDAKLTRARIYRTISRHLDAKEYYMDPKTGKAKPTKAPNYQAQKEAYRTALTLHRDLRDEDNETPISSIGALVFNIITSNKREVIDVA